MGFFSRFTDESSQGRESLWRRIKSESEIEDLLRSSNEKVIIILKHSFQCGTSYVAKNNIESFTFTEEDNDLILIDVIRQRNISMHLAQHVGVRHESPQLLVIRNGKVIWHGSHYQVTTENLEQALAHARG